MLGAAALSSSFVAGDAMPRDLSTATSTPRRRVLWLVARLATLADLLSEAERVRIQRSVQPGDQLAFYVRPDPHVPRGYQVRVEVADAETAAGRRGPAAPWTRAGLVRITDDGEELLA